MRKIFTLFLLLIPLWMQAQDDDIWDEESKTLTVTLGETTEYSSYKDQAKHLVIKVGTSTEIGWTAFMEWKLLQSVTISEEVTSIGRSAFFNCPSLKEITIPKNVTSIGEMAFQSTALTEVTIPGNVKSIERQAFYGCSALKKVTIGEGVESIGKLVFQECTALTEVTIPGSVESIGIEAFYGCTLLTSIVYEGTTEPTIDTDAFSNINAEATVTVPENYTGDGFGNFSIYQIKGKECSITLSEVVNGSISVQVNGQEVTSVKSGDEVTLVATPTDGYMLDTWTVTDKNNDKVEVTDNTFTMPFGGVTVSATFKKKSYTLTLTQPTEGGTITAKVDETNVENNSTVEFEKTVTLEAEAKEGYKFKAWNVTANGTEITVMDNTFEMPASDVTVTATFTAIEEPEPEDPETPIIPDMPDYYNIMIEECEGVTVETSSTVVREGQSMTFTVDVAEGYTSEDMTVKVKRSLFGYTEVIEPNDEGIYEIKNIYTDIYITVDGVEEEEEETPTGMEDVESAKVYTKDGSIYVQTPKQEQVQIISISGSVLKNETQIGLQRYDLPRGIYIIGIGEERYKVRN